MQSIVLLLPLCPPAFVQTLLQGFLSLSRSESVGQDLAVGQDLELRATNMMTNMGPKSIA